MRPDYILILIMVEPYFRYYPPPPELTTWGLGVMGAGFAKIAPGQSYPPSQHPKDHSFTWERGRILESMQLISISKGSGWFESRLTGRLKITENTAFILLPGVWHRYCPDTDKGWEESWCELRGPTVEQLLRDGILSAAKAVRSGVFECGLNDALEHLHRRVRSNLHPGFDAQLSSLALRVLAIWNEMERPSSEPAQALQAITRAERYIADHISEQINLKELAQSEGIAYSHFRRLFRSCTGYSPWQYIINLRMEMARRMLAGSDLKLGVISDALGFSSAFHFSSTFKANYGVSPSLWRRQVKESYPSAAQASSTER